MAVMANRETLKRSGRHRRPPDFGAAWGAYSAGYAVHPEVRDEAHRAVHHHGREFSRHGIPAHFGPHRVHMRRNGRTISRQHRPDRMDIRRNRASGPPTHQPILKHFEKKLSEDGSGSALVKGRVVRLEK